jgi:2-oxoisovalerate dehydrogenase E1 component
MVAGINRVMKEEKAVNPRIVMFGEDVADATHEENLARSRARAACSRSRTACREAYGSDRVFNSPLAEANIIGRAVGMAVRG